MYKFNKAQTEWLEALESGEYDQTKSVLCEVDADKGPSYCCLGVASELYPYGKWVDDPDSEVGEKLFCLRGKDFDAWPPQSVWKRLKLRSESGELTHPITYADLFGVSVTASSLGALNDAGFSFSTIASICRTFPELVFTNA